MPFTSPFGSITTPSFNPSYSNVPQNKPPKPAAVPETKPPQVSSIPETPESSVELLNAGIRPKIFSTKTTEGSPEIALPRPAAMPRIQMPLPVATPAPMPLPQPASMPLQPQFVPAAMPGLQGFMIIPIPTATPPTPQQGVAVEQPGMPTEIQRLNPHRPIFV